ncbi:VH1-interacting kinase [Forsythia ovata]|uniref:VH1-interacting kinase n=1 Tax=Forsythia ovata TaxID=205694 RepID=A0ABD1WLV2_9LAMI
MKLRHPNIVQSLGAATEKKPLMLITEHMSGGDLHQFLKEKGALAPLNAINFALDIARNILLVNSSADHLKVGDVGLKKLVRVQSSHDADRYMAPQAFKGQKYEKQANVFSFAMILYEMLEGDPPLSNYEQYEAARYVADGTQANF